jgi:AcrR family transcriptional regulator
MRAEKKHSDIRREQIAQAAMDLIAAQGMKNLSVAAVARRVGLVPSALYRHFKGKEEILKAVIERVRELLLENVQSVRQATPFPLEQFRLLLRRHIRMIREFQALPRIIFSDEILASYPKGRSAVYDIIQEFLGQVAQLVARGQRAGQINPGLDPETVAVLFLGLVQPPVVLWTLSNGRFDVTKHMDQVWPIFKKAISLDNPKTLTLEKLTVTKEKTKRNKTKVKGGIDESFH